MVGWLTRSVRVGGGLFLLAMAGCGGRTSTLDDGIYETGGTTSDGGTTGGGNTGTGAGTSHGGSATAGSTAAGSTGSGGTSMAGSAGTGVGGGGPAGTGGASTGGASTGGASTGGSAGTGGSTGGVNPCWGYCKDLVSGLCPNAGTPYDECVSSCTDALYRNNAACLVVGTQLVNCLTAVLEKPPSTCSLVLDDAQKICQAQITVFGVCDQSTTPPPVSCELVSGGTQNTCNASKKCSDGTYFVAQCIASGTNLSTCSCSTANGASAGVTLNEGVSFACEDALAVCGAPN